MTGHFGHHLIGNDQVELSLAESFKCFSSILSRDDTMAIVCKILGQNFAKQWLIVSDEDAEGTGYRGRVGLRDLVGRGVFREGDNESGATTFDASNVESSAMPLDASVNHGQTQPGSQFAF